MRALWSNLHKLQSSIWRTCKTSLWTGSLNRKALKTSSSLTKNTYVMRLELMSPVNWRHLRKLNFVLTRSCTTCKWQVNCFLIWTFSNSTTRLSGASVTLELLSETFKCFTSQDAKLKKFKVSKPLKNYVSCTFHLTSLTNSSTFRCWRICRFSTLKETISHARRSSCTFPDSSSLPMLISSTIRSPIPTSITRLSSVAAPTSKFWMMRRSTRQMHFMALKNLLKRVKLPRISSLLKTHWSAGSSHSASMRTSSLNVVKMQRSKEKSLARRHCLCKRSSLWVKTKNLNNLMIRTYDNNTPKLLRSWRQLIKQTKIIPSFYDAPIVSLSWKLHKMSRKD